MTQVRNDPYPDVLIGGGFSDPQSEAAPEQQADDGYGREGGGYGGYGPEGGGYDDASGGHPHPYAPVGPDDAAGANGHVAEDSVGAPGAVDAAAQAPGGAPVAAPASRWRRLLRPAPAPGSSRWRRGRVAAGVTGAVGVLPLVHSWVPNTPGNLGSLLETLLPWCGLAVPLGLLAALRVRSAAAALAAALAAVVWLAAFWPAMAGGSAAGAPGAASGLTVVTHNIGAGHTDPAAAARSLLAARPDLVALEEITDAAFPAVEKVLTPALRHHVRIGTVALWSRHPFNDTRRLVLDPGWSRSLRAEVRAPGGPIAVYVVHLPSVRVGLFGFGTGARDRDVRELDRVLGEERQDRVLLLGDLNGSTADRTLAPLAERLRSAQDTAGGGFGMSWPAAFPVARVDHILDRGLTPTDAWTLPATGSDHLPVAARYRR
ncbi:endonuclease/exonuclease/phosphatase family protein [Streptomyces sp. NPDC004111]|uniref:endonuclease/exonuclease/phosphatase family protein n=1 Tax=Streptomyces sp. NPDC004111 TaxID=3364690 RepID=UPI0036817ED1